MVENELGCSVYDGYPVTTKRMLVIPKRHVADYFELYRPERNAIQMLLERARERIREMDSSVTGFNVGINIGRDAGQTIFHCHIHLIPSRLGDMDDPQGGVRGVIPAKRKLLESCIRNEISLWALAGSHSYIGGIRFDTAGLHSPSRHKYR